MRMADLIALTRKAALLSLRDGEAAAVRFEPPSPAFESDVMADPRRVVVFMGVEIPPLTCKPVVKCSELPDRE